MSTKTIAILGAAGETGQSITHALLATDKFEITALVRPSSMDKEENISLERRGVKLVPTDLNGSQEELVRILTGIDTVISVVGWMNQLDQLPLVTAANSAGVKRFVPCGFITIAPPNGNQTIKMLEEMSGETIEKEYISSHEVKDRVENARKALSQGPVDFSRVMQVGSNEYYLSWGVRGDNSPEYAKYLGYLTSKELYPDFEGVSFEDFLKEVLEGNARRIFPHLNLSE